MFTTLNLECYKCAMCEDEISLCKWSGGIAHLCSCAH